MTEPLEELATDSTRGGLATLVSAAPDAAGIEEVRDRWSLIFCGEDCEGACEARCETGGAALATTGADFCADLDAFFP